MHRINWPSGKKIKFKLRKQWISGISTDLIKVPDVPEVVKFFNLKLLTSFLCSLSYIAKEYFCCYTQIGSVKLGNDIQLCPRVQK